MMKSEEINKVACEKSVNSWSDPFLKKVYKDAFIDGVNYIISNKPKDLFVECIEMADLEGVEIMVFKNQFNIGVFDYDKDKFSYSNLGNPHTLPELHAKLTELTKG